MAYVQFGLAEDDASGRSADLADHLEAGGRTRVLHHVPAGRGIGIMERGPTVHVSDLGIATSMPRSRSTRGLGRPRAATALMPSPPYRRLRRVLTGDYQRGR
jgi:hypothetical protein